MITILMSVYARESPVALTVALRSLCEQTVAPDEVVLVKDGPLTPELDAVIANVGTRLPLRVITLSDNVGLARALNEGLRAVSHPWVMRFDSDDICVARRLEWQRARILNDDVDLFGGQIDEFTHAPADVRQSRQVPRTHAEIIQFARRRNPFNHMTVCYRKALVDKIGGYPDIPYMEDFALWLRMLAAGARTANLGEVLVHARIGNGMLARRGGYRYVRSEWRLQALMHELGLKSRIRMVVDGTLRSLVFLSPIAIRGLIYRYALRTAQAAP